MGKSERLNIRASGEQMRLLRRAAGASGQTISDYVLSRVLADAKDELADRRVFALSSPEWTELTARLDRPAERRPELGQLLSTPRPWDHGPPAGADERRAEVLAELLERRLDPAGARATRWPDLALTLGDGGPQLWVSVGADPTSHALAKQLVVEALQSYGDPGQPEHPEDPEDPEQPEQPEQPEDGA